MIRHLKIAAAMLVLPAAALIFTNATSAVGEGQVEGGDIYRIKNITKNVTFTDPANADACNDLMYMVRVHNPGPGSLTNVNVKASLPSGTASSHSSTVTVSAINADPASTSDTAVVNLSSAQSLGYINGSTQLLDANGAVMESLADGITQGGVNIGNVGVSINEKRFVQFQVKVNCPQPPQVKFACKALSVSQISRTDFDFTATATAENATVQSYTFTAKNSGGSTVDTKTVATSALSANYQFSQTTAGTYTVTATVNTDKGSATSTDCTKHVTVKEDTPPPPQVKFACKALDAKEVSRTRFDFTAKAEVENANVTSYVFTAKDNSGNTVDTNTVTTNALSANYTFEQSKAGTYTVSAVVNTDKGSTNPADCVKKVTVKEQPPTPVFECTALDAKVGDNRKVTITVTHKAENGAVFKTVSYDFGDGSNPLVTDKTSVEHSYAKDGTYTVSATLTFNVGETTKTVRCTKTVTITTPVPPQVLPAETSKGESLPNTGSGGLVGLFAGASALGAVGHYAVAIRRNRKE